MVRTAGPLQTLRYREAKCYPEPLLPAPPGLEGEDPPAHPARVSPAGSMRWILQTFRKHSPL